MTRLLIWLIALLYALWLVCLHGIEGAHTVLDRQIKEVRAEKVRKLRQTRELKNKAIENQDEARRIKRFLRNL